MAMDGAYYATMDNANILRKEMESDPELLQQFNVEFDAEDELSNKAQIIMKYRQMYQSKPEPDYKKLMNRMTRNGGKKSRKLNKKRKSKKSHKAKKSRKSRRSRK